MDVAGASHYVAVAMEWLLIFSALLSAVTGAISGGRSAEPGMQQAEAAVGAQVAVAAATQQVARARAVIPANSAPAAEPARPPLLSLPTAIPLYADRLLE